MRSLVTAAFRSAGKRSPQTGVGRHRSRRARRPKSSATKDDPKWSEAYGKLPLSFEETRARRLVKCDTSLMAAVTNSSDGAGSGAGVAPKWSA